jgi:hypothetical protein
LKNGDWLLLNPEKHWLFHCLPVHVLFFQQAVEALLKKKAWVAKAGENFTRQARSN